MPVRSDGAQFRRRRKLTGLSATELANQVGYSLNHISQVELGNSNAGPQLLRKAAEIFGCDVGDLMTEDAPPPDDTDATGPARAVA
jgi:transcriptional regulator with XRE-family HTH domain